jgi:hypothetical protein
MARTVERTKSVRHNDDDVTGYTDADSAMQEHRHAISGLCESREVLSVHLVGAPQGWMKCRCTGHGSEGDSTIDMLELILLSVVYLNPFS